MLAQGSRGSTSGRGRSSSSSSGRGNAEGRGRQSENEGWQSRPGNYGRDFEGGYYQASGSRGWEGDRQDYRGAQDWDDRGNRGGQSRSQGGYQGRGGQDYWDGRDSGVQSRPHGRGYGDERSFGSGRGGGGFQDDDVRGGFTRQDHDWRPSDGRRSASREGGSWDEGRGYGGERGFGSGRSGGYGGERDFGRERSFGGESESSFREREYAPERGRSEGYRGDDRFSGYVEGDVRDYGQWGRHTGGYQNEDEEERYYSGRGQRGQGRSESRRGSSSRASEQRWRE